MNSTLALFMAPAATLPCQHGAVETEAASSFGIAENGPAWALQASKYGRRESKNFSAILISAFTNLPRLTLSLTPPALPGSPIVRMSRDPEQHRQPQAENKNTS
ncbi:hypothetical protein MXD81_35215 [Microbacteriaceae bacterium K1510]|nr:hypothetical protein [Microbacteriaceae bacterium K1510]